MARVPEQVNTRVSAGSDEKSLASVSVSEVFLFKEEIDHQQELRKLLSSLRGQTIRIPDLAPLFRHWPTKTNVDLDLLRNEVKDWLMSTVPSGPVLSALLLSDFGLFAATWCPCASFERLKIFTYMFIWLFVWDDQFDQSDGALYADPSAAQAYRNSTLTYMRYSLGIDNNALDPAITDLIILNFAPVGDALQKTYTREQRQRVYDAMVFYISMTELEQGLQLSGAIPSVEEYWKYRPGTSAVFVCIAFNEYAWEGMDLPAAFYDDADVKQIQKCTNTLVAAVNDLLSLKKEMKRGAIHSLVPIYLHNGRDLQTAVEMVVSFIAGEIKAMDDAAQSLFERYENADEGLKKQVAQYVAGCKYYLTGNLTWSLETRRYGVERVDGQIVMTL